MNFVWKVYNQYQGDLVVKNKFQKIGYIIIIVALSCFVSYRVLKRNNIIGTHSSKLISQVYSLHKTQDWKTEGEISDTMAAFVSYSADRSEHAFSIYLNHPGFSFGYFYCQGGSVYEIDQGIVEYTSEGYYDESAFISMNKQKVDRLEINDGTSVQMIDIDSDKPFALVLPTNSGRITFYDENGNKMNVVKQSLI